MNMMPDRASYPRIDALMEVAYHPGEDIAPGFHTSEGGISFLLKSNDSSIVAGTFIELRLRFATLDVDVQCSAICTQVLPEGQDLLGVFQFVNTAPETVESIRSIAFFHMLRMNREEAQAKQVIMNKTRVQV